jgi:crotonobetainyl-CoA:carnitine CoA-transferase CaiB-like acyl-CoA transferase
MNSAPPLEGTTVIDFTRVLSGPYCTMLLADMGARVIKIEQPGCGDDTRAWGPPFVQGESAYFLSVNRNKESLALDLKASSGRRAISKLLDRADVIVENFRPGTMDRLGLGYDALSAACPALVYCSISGFGQSGPRRDEPGYDAVIQAEGGLMSITGAADGPPFRLGVAISDIVTGLFAAQGIAMALLSRVRTGRGQRVDVGMLDATTALLTYQAGIHFATGGTPVRMGNRHPTIVPYETFEASDGEFVLAIGNDEIWRRFCRVLQIEGLDRDERFATNRDRVAHYDDLRPLLAARLKLRPRLEWETGLKAVGVPCGSVRTIADALADSQLDARQMIETVDHVTAGAIRVLGVPIKLSDSPGAVRMAPPTLGQHTDAILRDDCGISEAEVAKLRSSGVIG